MKALKTYYVIKAWKWSKGKREYESVILLDSQYGDDKYNTEERMRKSFEKVRLSKDVPQVDFFRYMSDGEGFSCNEEFIGTREF